jgi:hypothetical protein
MKSENIITLHILRMKTIFVQIIMNVQDRQSYCRGRVFNKILVFKFYFDNKFIYLYKQYNSR